MTTEIKVLLKLYLFLYYLL